MKKGKNIDELLTALWNRYKDNPEIGVTTEEVMAMIESIGGKEVRNQFELRISTTEDIDFESYYKAIGCEFEWEASETPYLGVTWNFEGERVFVKQVTLDSPAYKAGLNAGDEILAVNKLRFLKEDADSLGSIMTVEKRYEVSLSRLGKTYQAELTPSKTPAALKQIRVVDQDKAIKAFARS